MNNQENVYKVKTETLKFTPLLPAYKYAVKPKYLNITLHFVDMTFMQKLFAIWFLSAEITKL
jgi:hypothetical protein